MSETIQIKPKEKYPKKLQFKDKSYSFIIYEPELSESADSGNRSFIDIDVIEGKNSPSGVCKRIVFKISTDLNVKNFVESRGIAWVEEKLSNGNFDKNLTILAINKKGLWGEKSYEDLGIDEFPKYGDRIKEEFSPAKEFFNPIDKDIDERLFTTFFKKPI
ncbi:MAG: hypothetical protein PHO48_03660 [Candidatus Gracilibacteria bacterium]|nr:hypothetical protein [Candidatus Gracilibacteria bacterium]MDD5179459.1 hypothetical protein [Candidatus Gracilibacteria bacterium]